MKMLLLVVIFSHLMLAICILMNWLKVLLLLLQLNLWWYLKWIFIILLSLIMRKLFYSWSMRMSWGQRLMHHVLLLLLTRDRCSIEKNVLIKRFRTSQFPFHCKIFYFLLLTNCILIFSLQFWTCTSTLFSKRIWFFLFNQFNFIKSLKIIFAFKLLILVNSTFQKLKFPHVIQVIFEIQISHVGLLDTFDCSLFWNE